MWLLISSDSKSEYDTYMSVYSKELNLTPWSKPHYQYLQICKGESEIEI